MPPVIVSSPWPPAIVSSPLSPLMVRSRDVGPPVTASPAPESVSAPSLPVIVPSSTFASETSTSSSALRFSAGGAERDDVAGRGAGDGDAVEDARGQVDDELDLRKARALHATPGANWPPLRSMVTFSAPVEPLTTIVSVKAVVAAPHAVTPTMMRPAFAPVPTAIAAESPAALMLTVAVPAAKPHVTAAPARGGQSEGYRGERRADNCDQPHHQASCSGSAPPANSLRLNRRGRLTSSPPQLGQTALMVSEQAGQNVHS